MQVMRIFASILSRMFLCCAGNHYNVECQARFRCESEFCVGPLVGLTLS